MKTSDGNDRPTWLRIMENSAIAEARARAFLIDRFWILERSVDVDGADYLIQRRLTDRNFLDPEPPRLGVVQVKYAQDGNTTHYIPKSYVCAAGGIPFGEFFLLVCMGRGDGEVMHFVTARDIAAHFTTVIDTGKGIERYVIPVKQLQVSDRFRITDKEGVLDEMQHALAIAEFTKNRWYIRRAGRDYVEIGPEHIDHDYTLPLDNTWGDIKKQFFTLKERVRSVQSDMQDVIEKLGRILRTTDPLEALSIVDAEFDIHNERISFYAGDLWDDDFWNTAKGHKAKVEELRAKGLLHPYLKLQEAVEARVLDDLAAHAPLDRNSAYRLTVSYDPETLALEGCGGDVADIPQKELQRSERMSDQGHRVLGDCPGKIRILCFVGQWSYGKWDSSSRKFIPLDPNAVKDWRVLIREHLWKVRRPIFESIDKHLDLPEI